MVSARLSLRLVAPIAAFALLAACAGAPESEATTEASGEYPITIKNCGLDVVVPAKPTRAVTMTAGATEAVLALGLHEKLAGTASQSDPVPEKWRAAYDSVEVLADDYPEQETLNKANPDFIYASYRSAFEEEAAGARENWAARDVATYISPFSCPEPSDRPPATFASVWNELSEIATILGNPQAAKEVKAEQSKRIDKLAKEAPGKGQRIFWYDSGTDTVYAGAGEGGPQLIIDAVGATNVFADVEGSWADLSWEKVVEADPDVVAFPDASWSTAKDKIKHLKKDPVLKELKAVKNEAFVIIPFIESIQGARIADGAISIGEQLSALKQ